MSTYYYVLVTLSPSAYPLSVIQNIDKDPERARKRERGREEGGERERIKVDPLMYTNGVPGFGIYDEQGDGIVYMYSLEQMSEKTVLFRRTFILFDGSVPHVISCAFSQSESANLRQIHSLLLPVRYVDSIEHLYK